MHSHFTTAPLSDHSYTDCHCECLLHTGCRALFALTDEMSDSHQRLVVICIQLLHWQVNQPNCSHSTGPTVNDHEVKFLRGRVGTSVRDERNGVGLQGHTRPPTKKEKWDQLDDRGARTMKSSRKSRPSGGPCEERYQTSTGSVKKKQAHVAKYR